MKLHWTYGFLFLCVSLTATAQSDLSLSLETSVEEGYFIVDVMAKSNAEELALGSSNFPFKIEAQGLNLSQALREPEEDGRFSPGYDPESYQLLELTQPGFLHLYLIRSEEGQGTGQKLGLEKEKLAQIKVPIEDPCGSARLEWITDRGGISTFSSKRPDLAADYHSDIETRFTPALETPEIVQNDQLLSIEGAEFVNYQWYQNGIAIPGAITPQYFAAIPGDYSVEISNQCETLVSEPQSVDLITEVHELDDVLLDVVAYPNPYDAQTLVTYRVPSSSEVKLEIIDEKGVLVQTLVHGLQAPGAYEVQFSAQQAGFAPGVYFAKLTSGKDVKVERLVELSHK